jgi:hypothetical protein
VLRAWNNLGGCGAVQFFIAGWRGVDAGGLDQATLLVLLPAAARAWVISTDFDFRLHEEAAFIWWGDVHYIESGIAKPATISG